MSQICPRQQPITTHDLDKATKEKCWGHFDLSYKGTISFPYFDITLGGAVLEDGDGIDLVQCYNPRTNQWVELSKMLIARSGSAACVLNGHIYVIGKIC